METYNDYNGGSGVCCQGAGYFGGAGVAGSTQYTYSIIYRSNSGYTHPNFMYRYEYGASGYITEGGLHNDGNRTHLGDGWYHAWGNMTTQPGTTSMGFYFYMYEYGTYNTIDIAGVMFTQGPEIIRPRQFIPFSATRSVTQGLLDLTGNYTIDLSNISFDSTGNIAFDGTNDFIDTNFPAMTINNPTIEAINELNAEFALFHENELNTSLENIIDLLKRPLRVCGMVRNEGQPGGGPFWVEENGEITKQIVEKSQISLRGEQYRLMVQSSYFNPVMIAAVNKDMNGKQFDLFEFRDENKYFVVNKNFKGKDIYFSELPGLWNGSMAHWNTLFVEVPLETSNPVKSVTDLLRPAHQNN
jgi:hypothetical protein